MENYDYAKLLGKMKEHGYTQGKLAKIIGISECSLNFSINNKRDFRQAEILKICKVLSIPLEKVDAYFFAHKL